jgi:hypothetical protein
MKGRIRHIDVCGQRRAYRLTNRSGRMIAVFIRAPKRIVKDAPRMRQPVGA